MQNLVMVLAALGGMMLFVIFAFGLKASMAARTRQRMSNSDALAALETRVGRPVPQAIRDLYTHTRMIEEEIDLIYVDPTPQPPDGLWRVFSYHSPQYDTCVGQIPDIGQVFFFAETNDDSRYFIKWPASAAPDPHLSPDEDDTAIYCWDEKKNHIERVASSMAEFLSWRRNERM